MFLRICRPLAVIALFASQMVWCSWSAAQDGAATAEKPATEEPKIDPDALFRQAYEKSQQAQDEAQFTEVIQMCQRGLKASPSEKTAAYGKSLLAWSYNRRGEVRADAGKEAEALADFKKSVEFDATRWKAFHNRGVSLAMQGDFEAAMADFDKVIELHPQYALAWFNRGELHSAAANWSAAIADYDRAVQLSSRDAASYISRGFAHSRTGNTNQALSDFNQALRIDAQNASARYQRGVLYTQLGRYAEAATDLRSAVDLDPESGQNYQAAAWLMATCPDQRFRDTERALEAARKAVELDGDENYLYGDTLAAALANAGQYEEAVAAQKQAIEVAGEESDRVKEELQKRLALYEQGEPYRPSARGGPRSVQVR